MPLGHLRHVLPAYQPRTNARQLSLMPIRMQHEERLGNHQAQHRVAQKLQPLVIARNAISVPVDRGLNRSATCALIRMLLKQDFVSHLLFGQRSVRQGARRAVRFMLG